VSYSEIKLIDRQLSSLTKDDLDYFQAVVKGEAKAAAADADAFQFLRRSALQKEPASDTAG
jgi:hypothetical protein